MSGDPSAYYNANVTFTGLASSWECHRCGAVNAPHASQCTCRGSLSAPYPLVGEPYAPLIPPDPMIAPGPGPLWPVTISCSTATLAPGCIALNSVTP